jgi:hypothetical protein
MNRASFRLRHQYLYVMDHEPTHHSRELCEMCLVHDGSLLHSPHHSSDSPSGIPSP